MSDISTDAYPRVLVINGEPFWQGSATGLTMSRLFAGWPKDNIACLYTSEIIPDRSICEHYWKLAFRDLRRFGGLVGSRLSKTRLGTSATENSTASSFVEPHVESGIGCFGKRLRLRLAGQAVRELDVYHVPRQVLEDIKRFSPQIIYSMLASNAVMHLVLEMADSLAIPVVPHFMDDWPSTLYSSSLLRPVLRRVMSQRLHTILAHSPKRLVIGDMMADEYIQRYGGEFAPFMNALEPEQLEQSFVLPAQHQILRLVYIGGLHLNRWHSLKEIGLALKTLRAEGYEAEARIYSQPRFAEEAKKLNIPPVMHFAGSVAPEQVMGILRDADILLHVESFDRTSRNFSRYSVSTKIPEIMCAARPIFAYGPAELASIRYVRESGAGLVVEQPDRTLVLAALRELLVSTALREALGKKGHQVAVQRHSAAVQRDQFLFSLKSVVK